MGGLGVDVTFTGGVGAGGDGAGAGREGAGAGAGAGVNIGVDSMTAMVCSTCFPFPFKSGLPPPAMLWVTEGPEEIETLLPLIDSCGGDCGRKEVENLGVTGTALMNVGGVRGASYTTSSGTPLNLVTAGPVTAGAGKGDMLLGGGLGSLATYESDEELVRRCTG